MMRGPANVRNGSKAAVAALVAGTGGERTFAIGRSGLRAMPRLRRDTDLERAAARM